MPDSKTPTLRDVALRAGVHPSTVSRALNPQTRSRVNTLTAKRVSAAARSLNYTPNAIARSLRTSRTRTIGMLVPDLTIPLFPPNVRGVEDVLAQHAYTVLLASTDNQAAREELQFEVLRTRQVDGLIIAIARCEHALTRRAIEDGVPVVLLHDTLCDDAVHAVIADDVAGTRAALTHVLDLGHTAIGYVAGPRDASPAVTRLQAFRSAMAERGLLREDLVVQCDRWTIAEGAAALRTLLDAGGDMTAVIAASDLLAVGCYDTLRARGLTCPGDLSVVGFHDMVFVDKLSPPLTTVRVHHHEMGAQAARLLLDLLDRPDDAPHMVVMPVELIARGSTAPPATTPAGR